MNTNPELELANTLIAQTGTNIFLTGKPVQVKPHS